MRWPQSLQGPSPIDHGGPVMDKMRVLSHSDLHERFGVMDRFSRDLSALESRVGVLNERLGCRYQCCPANPAVVRRSRGVVSVTLFGASVARVPMWDAVASSVALRDVELCGSVLVSALSAGALVPLPAWG